MSARRGSAVSPTRRAVKFHVSSNVTEPVLSRHITNDTNTKKDLDDDDDVDDNDFQDDLLLSSSDENDSLDDLPTVSADTLDKLIASYESLMVVGALLAGFAISLLPNVVERKHAAEASTVSNLWLSAARLCLFLVISCNFFAICALSLANFYLSQLWEKRRLRVVHFRVMTQSYRQLAHHAIVASIPLFATGVALWAAHHWRPFAPDALWNSPFEILSLLVLLGTIGAVVATIHVHRNAFVHTLLAKAPARRRLAAGRRDVSTGGSVLVAHPHASSSSSSAAASASRRTTSSSSAAAAPGTAMSMANAAAAAAAAADIDHGASGGAIKRFHTKYF
jgi:hypothetical protein